MKKWEKKALKICGVTLAVEVESQKVNQIRYDSPHKRWTGM